MAQTSDINKTRLTNKSVVNDVLSLDENVKTSYLIEENDNLSEVLQHNLKEEIAAQSLILSSKRGFFPHNSFKTSNQDQQNKEGQSISLLQSSVSHRVSRAVSYQNEHNYDASVSYENLHRVGAIAINKEDTKFQQHKNQDDINTNCKESENQLEIPNDTNSIPFEAGVSHDVLASMNVTVSSPNASNDSHQTDIIMTEVELQPSLELSKYPQLFVCTTAQEAHELVKQYAEETLSTFVSMRKMKQFGITGCLLYLLV